MDPRQALLDLLAAICERDTDAFFESADALYTWLNRGGYIPAEALLALEAAKLPATASELDARVATSQALAAAPADAVAAKSAQLDALEAVIDQRGLANVLADLESICYDKADHIRTNWQDGASAKPWDRTGRQLGNIAGNAERLGLTNG